MQTITTFLPFLTQKEMFHKFLQRKVYAVYLISFIILCRVKKKT